MASSVTKTLAGLLALSSFPLVNSAPGVNPRPASNTIPISQTTTADVGSLVTTTQGPGVAHVAHSSVAALVEIPTTLKSKLLVQVARSDNNMNAADNDNAGNHNGPGAHHHSDHMPTPTSSVSVSGQKTTTTYVTPKTTQKTTSTSYATLNYYSTVSLATGPDPTWARFAARSESSEFVADDIVKRASVHKTSTSTSTTSYATLNRYSTVTLATGPDPTWARFARSENTARKAEASVVERGNDHRTVSSITSYATLNYFSTVKLSTGPAPTWANLVRSADPLPVVSNGYTSSLSSEDPRLVRFSTTLAPTPTGPVTWRTHVTSALTSATTTEDPRTVRFSTVPWPTFGTSTSA